VLLQEDLVDWAAAHLDSAWVQHPVAREIIARRLKAREDHSWTSLAAFLEVCDTPEMLELVTEVVAADRPVPNPAQQLADVALRLRNQFIDRQLAQLTHRASQPEMPEADRLDLLRQQQELRSQKRNPLN
jgi:hypothetical protein